MVYPSHENFSHSRLYKLWSLYFRLVLSLNSTTSPDIRFTEVLIYPFEVLQD